MTEINRKRNLEQVIKEDETNIKDNSSTTTMTQGAADPPLPPLPPPSSEPPPPPPPFLPLRKLRLEAVFHPKFENENQQLKSTRERMKEQCLLDSDSGGGGYLEVSVKHSGSLLLWSGGQRYYSKNATSNLFTQAGEILLRQHFVRAFWNDDDSDTDDGCGAAASSESMYQECSDYVQAHRLTLSFEVVTSVLGDHGARPHRDFLILTAVADRSRAAAAAAAADGQQQFSSHHLFYSTVEVMEFAQKFRLPHNDCWVYAAEPAVNALFDFYDTSRETGTTSTLIAALTQAAGGGSGDDDDDDDDCSCYYVQSMYPHADFQGEIMEGIVIRFVPCTDRVEAMARMARLSRQSRETLKRIPPNLPDCHELLLLMRDKRSRRDAASDADAEPTATPPPPPPVLTTNLRQLYDKTKAAYTKRGADEFAACISALVSDSPFKKQQLRQTDRMASIPSSDLVEWVDDLVKDSSQLDEETKRIATLIQSLSKLSKNVVYSIIREHVKDPDDEHDASNTTTRYLCIVHVLHDQTFQQYHRAMEKGDMPLFRGFSFEIFGGADDAAVICTPSCSVSTLATCRVNSSGEYIDESGETLMLKMKFLPYMVRTFACRNGLKIIRDDGPVAFAGFVQRLLSKWGISQRAQQEWTPFFRAWAQYSRRCMRGNPMKETKDLAPLSSFYYLDHLEFVQELFKAGKLSALDGMESPKCLLQGLVVVVSVNLETANIVADFIAEQLGGAKRIDVYDEVNAGLMASACDHGRGHVCAAVIDNGSGRLRKLLKKYADFISVILFQTSEDDISAFLPTNKASLGMLQGWKKTTCARVIELPGSSLFDPNDMDTEDGKILKPNAAFSEMLSQLQQSVAIDERPGVLVFFPTMPGSGKSACVTGIDKECDAFPRRSVVVQQGDATKEKFWPLVRRMRQRDCSCVFIADKNAPASVWGTVGQICASTKALAVPVLPDASALRTTRVVGIRSKDGVTVAETVHFYPFSLQYLAVCIARVMDRPAASHAGELDQGAARACMIVVKFFSFYRSISADQFLVELTKPLASAGAIVTPAPIEVPFFSSGRGTEALPDDLEEVLVEALRCQYGYDRKNDDATKAEDEYLNDLEQRLRECISRHRDNILSRTAEESVTRQSFLSSLVEKVAEAESITSYEAPSFVKIASIDVEVGAVHEILLRLREEDRLSSFFDSALKGSDIHDVLSSNGTDHTNAEGLGFVSATHVTLAHCRQMSQSELRSKFTPHLGCEIELLVSGLLWNERVMALAVTVAETTKNGEALPAAQNSFVHVTLWHEKGASPVEANDLPRLLEAMEAQRIEFESPIPLVGIVSLWNT